MKINKIVVSLCAAGVMASPLAYATNGMNLEGYGPVASAMGGASMAYDNGTAAVMNNPATLGLMSEGSRADIALGILAPDITSKYTGMPSADSSATAFYMPAMGYAHKSGKMTYGVGVFSQGGMGTEYGANSFLAAGSGKEVRSEVGVGRFIVPLVYQVDEKITVGGSLDFVWAGMDLKMAMSGAQFGDMAFGTKTYGTASGSMVNILGGAIGTNPGQLSSTGPINWARVDFSDNGDFTGQAKGNGGAFKLGGTYKVSPQLTLRATYHSKPALGDLTTSGAEMSMNVNVNGAPGPFTVPVTGSISVKDFQWPQTFGFGAAYQASDKLLIVADYKNIGWKDVMKDFKVTFTANAVQTDANALAFGLGGQVVDMTMIQNWEDQNVFEIGGAYKMDDALTLRAGINVANNPVPDKYMNPLFPAIGQNHVSLGAGYVISSASSVDFSYVQMLTKTATATGTPLSVDFGGYSTQIMYSHRY